MTQYSDSRRSEVLGIALAVGDKEASKRTSVPRRTISRWRQEVREGSPRADLLLDAPTREAVASKLWEGVTIATAQVVAGLQDPKARLGDKARALDTLATQHALLVGDVTSRTETRTYSPQAGDDGLEWWENALGGPLSDDERRYMRDSMDLVEAWLLKTLLTEMRKARAEGGDLVTLDPAGLTGQHWTAERVGSRMVRTVVEPPQLADGRNGQ